MTSVPVARYRFDIKLHQPLPIPDYAGSMLRGCFGLALKQSSCICGQKHTDDSAIHHPSCPYSLIFEPMAPKGHHWSQKQFPVPYIIEPDTSQKRVLHANQTYSFSMVLIGPAINLLSFVILAWQRAWYKGVGKYRSKGELTTVSVQTDNGWEQVFTHESGIITPHQTQLELKNQPSPETLTLKLRTPLRILSKSKPIGPDKITAKLLLQSILRRSDLIAQCYFGDQSQQGKQLLADIDQITLKHDLGWRDWTRYSNRQQQKMSLGGMIGTIQLSGDLDSLYSHIKLCEWLHIGKNTPFGLGQYSILPEA